MNKTRTTMADGRELIYFDASPTDRTAPDRRPIEPLGSPTTEIRFDPTTGDWVAMADHRQGRTYLPPRDSCPLCPSRKDSLTEIPAADYEVVVFENRFPAFRGLPGVESPDPVRPVPLLGRRPAAGRCEVVCFAADHNGTFGTLSPARARMIVDVWADRTADLSAVPGIEQVFCFENRGEEIGVTLHHPHGQIYGYPFVTPFTERLLAQARRYRERQRGDLFADLLEAETRVGERVVLGGEHWTAFVPHAAHWPVEVHLYPHRRISGLPELTTAERDELADAYQGILQRLEAAFGDRVPYISAWQQAPVGGAEDFRLHLRLFSNRRAAGKLKHLAGSEAAMGAFVNDLLPETVAAMLRGGSARP